MGDMHELIEAPLSSEALAARYRALCNDPCYANVPGKIELDIWGRMVMSPASNYHSALQTALAGKLAALGGRVWIVFPQSKRVEFHGPEGLLPRSQFAIDRADIFS